MSEDQDRADRALMAYEAMAFKWVQDHGVDKAIDAVATNAGGRASQVASAIHGLVTQAWIEGADSGFSARKALSDGYRDHAEEMDKLFEMTWAADRRAVEAWRRAHPGNERTLPDREKLMFWLLSQVTSAILSEGQGSDKP